MVYKMLCQQVVAVSHQVDEHMQEVDTVKYDGIVNYVFVERIFKVTGMFCPVHGAIYVVADVVAIIPAFYIVLGIDAGNAILITVFRVININKCVLRPVACHSYDAEGKKWQNEHHQRSRPIDKTQAPHT